MVRKLMVPLVRDGLVASIRGRSGGSVCSAHWQAAPSPTVSTNCAQPLAARQVGNKFALRRGIGRESAA
ncbi:Rrf2 family transcriptional regulator [Streptomyces sp. NBC_01261]|nr:hypothetical protein [Streptomyces sp. NBC_01261]